MASSLKNKLSVFSILLLIVLGCVQCGGSGEGAAANKDSADCAKPVNPNGDSELAVLMREMMSSSQNMRQMVLQGNLPAEFPEAFLKIHTARPTDSETKKASFENHADNYILNLRSLYQSPKEDLTSNYNALINSCISCHGEHCPGPLKTIEKLKI